MFVSERIFDILRHHNRIVKRARVVLVVVTAVAVLQMAHPISATRTHWGIADAVVKAALGCDQPGLEWLKHP
jgi:hypothetical protein